MNDLQRHILSIYKEFYNICNQSNLNFYAIGGTCLGAIRHQGFIPWDDDLDVAMPRKDYEKLKSILRTDLKKPYELIDEHSIYHYECFFSKIHDTNTTFLHDEMMRFNDRKSGVYIDIMPLDGLPNNEYKRKLHLKIIKNLMKANIWQKDIPQTDSKMKKLSIRFLKLFPKNFFLKCYLKLVKKYDFNLSTYSSFAWSQNCEKYILETKDFSSFVFFKFEDTTMRCPVGYDNYLTTHFGNYMEIPSENNKVIHKGIIDLTKSYKLY
ncbi:LicD family protein [Enterococcus casseliflavus]|uniref:LicD family protein n=1 Tax=Enterococcus casseliflavus TaxID=37734 RepID=UPI0029555865|nr:LicD family protein [Enterococcus casseliflavus]MDV7751301.1 LicD family protein [Enterococcus casseliflavus]